MNPIGTCTPGREERKSASTSESIAQDKDFDFFWTYVGNPNPGIKLPQGMSNLSIQAAGQKSKE